MCLTKLTASNFLHQTLTAYVLRRDCCLAGEAARFYSDIYLPKNLMTLVSSPLLMIIKKC